MDDNKNITNRSEDIDTILVIDPNRQELDILYKDLLTLGYPAITSETLEESLDVLKNKEVTVVICAQKQTKNKTGIDVLRQIASNYPEVERILLLDKNSIEAFHRDFKKNAPLCSVLQKPWQLSKLQYTIERALEKNKLIKENHHLQQKLLLQHANIAKQQKNMREKMSLGGFIHKKVLLGPIPQNIAGFKGASASLAAKEIEGNFFEFLQPNSTTIDLIIGDVIGKGVPSALLSSAIKTHLVRYGLPSTRAQVMKKERIWEEDLFTPEEILERVHTELSEQLVQFEFLAPLFYSRFNLLKRSLNYVDCGFSKPLHFVAKEERITLLRGNNFPLGVAAKAEYKSHTIPYSPGDLFIFHSKGVIETLNPSGEQFGLERLIEAILENKNATVDEIANNIVSAIHDFMQSEVRDEDITVVVIGITHETIVMADSTKTAKFKTDLSQAAAVRDFVGRCCMKAPGNCRELAEQMQLAINEIFCNIVKHGFKAKSIGEIVIQVELEEQGIRFGIADQGPSFNPEAIREPSLTGDRYDGFGWYMVQKIADEIVYLHKQVEDGWNHLELYKSYILEQETMEIGNITEGDVMIITPKISALDAKDVKDFKEKVMDIIMNKNPEGLKKFILDLKQLDFVDSSGLGSFLSILRYLRDHGGALRLANMNKSVSTIFELVSMHKVFETHQTLEDAKNSFKK